MKQLRDYQKKVIDECWRELRKNDDPVLLMASVGSGKSLMLAFILRDIQNAGKRALCIVNNAELVYNNRKTLVDQGGEASTYCASLGYKDCSRSVVFATPQSIINGIKKNEEISKIKFNLIVVDEAHTINHINNNSLFMRILGHYKKEYHGMRVLGATGTNFRFKGSSIVGDECFFKKQVGNITTEKLIEDSYLIRPQFKVDEKLIIDFSNVKLKNNGQFDKKQLNNVIEKSVRLTELICKQIIHIMESQSRFGVFIFATTKKHAYEILSHLPDAKSALILGETPQEERMKILEDARCGKIKYLVNISIISVGVDVPAFDTIAYLRPTESLVLLIQTMGRVLRLSPDTNKTEALVLDFAGNIDRHRDWDNPIILDAVKNTIDKDHPLVIQCPSCLSMNSEHSRRCIGKKNASRCDYYFEFKECPNKECSAKNDIASRHCHKCQEEIIDPNEKLNINIIKSDSSIEYEVIGGKYVISGDVIGFRINCLYTCKSKNGSVVTLYESYVTSSDKSRRVFYGNFIRKHCNKPSDWYLHMNNRIKMIEMLNEVSTPKYLLVTPDINYYKIKKKIFK